MSFDVSVDDVLPAIGGEVDISPSHVSVIRVFNIFCRLVKSGAEK